MFNQIARRAILLAFLGTLSAVPKGLAFQAPCQEQGRRTTDELVERWAWESFWDGTTSGFVYQPRPSATLDVFSNAGFAGMCSVDLGACTTYEKRETRLGQFVSADRLRGADLLTSTEIYLRELANPRFIREADVATNQNQPGAAGRFKNGDTVLSVPTPPSELVIRRNASGFQTCIVAGVRLPALRLPRVIQDKVRPEGLAAFEQWLKGRLKPGPAGTKSEYLIPYYGPNDPIVYVLVRLNGATESVIFALPEENEAGWKLGGHFDAKESPGQLQRLEKLILSAEMTAVRR